MFLVSGGDCGSIYVRYSGIAEQTRQVAPRLAPKPQAMG